MTRTLPSSEPKYSVLITSYRSLRFLEKCLGSVLRSEGPDFELLFLENGSPEPEAEWIAANLSDPRLHVFRVPETLYFAGGINYLAQRARGEFLVMLNADTVVVPGWLAALDDFLTATGFEGVAADIRDASHPDQPGNVTVRLDAFGLTRLTRLRGDGTDTDLVLGGCGLALRRDAFYEVGALDGDFRMYFEDIDLCWRMGLRGYRIGYEPRAVVYHAGQGSARNTGFPWNRFRGRRNRIWTYVKNAGLGTLAVFIPAYGVIALLILLGNLLRGRFRLAAADAAALAAALFHLRVALSKRPEIQATRKIGDAGLARRGFLALPWVRSKGAG